MTSIYIIIAKREDGKFYWAKGLDETPELPDWYEPDEFWEEWQEFADLEETVEKIRQLFADEAPEA
jgi:hypothetical protein